jgi:hypothetical protein
VNLEEQYIEARLAEQREQLRKEYRQAEAVRIKNEQTAARQAEVDRANAEQRRLSTDEDERLRKAQADSEEKRSECKLIVCEVCGEPNIFSTQVSHKLDGERKCVRNPRKAFSHGHITKAQLDEIIAAGNLDRGMVIDAPYLGDGAWKASKEEKDLAAATSQGVAVNPALQPHDPRRIIQYQ